MTEAASDRDHCDVLVIGGGPGGSTVSSLLAENGWRVVLLEKDHHPRFHIGESLLPMNLPILERLGVLDQVERIGVVKNGVEFNLDRDGVEPQVYYFGNARDRGHPHAFEVRRAEFDHILLKNAAKRGASVREGERVTAVEAGDDGGYRVDSVDDDGQARRWTCRYLIDASGRDSFMSRRLGFKRRHPKHGMAALFGHFDGVERRRGKDEGNISVYWFEHGWFWMIPLQDGVMSVGAVCSPEYLKSREGSPDDFLWSTIRLCPGASERMANARLRGEARATGNYSYQSTRLYGDDYLLVGDAYAFVDPVFSSGVYLAMSGATRAADAVDAVLREDPAATRLLKTYQRSLDHAIGMFSWFIFRFMSPAFRHLFASSARNPFIENPRNVFQMESSIISLLAGDVYRDTPIRGPLFAFKLMYYWHSLLLLPATLKSWLQRRRNAATVFSGGTTAQDSELGG